MHLDPERRKVRAQFLNGLAVAIVSTGVLTPIAAGRINLVVTVLALGIAGLMHLLAMRLP